MEADEETEAPDDMGDAQVEGSFRILLPLMTMKSCVWVYGAQLTKYPLLSYANGLKAWQLRKTIVVEALRADDAATLNVEAKSSSLVELQWEERDKKYKVSALA